MTGFRVNIFANRNEQTTLNQWLMNFDQLTVQRYSTAQLKDSLAEIPARELTIIWIDHNVLRSLQIISSNGKAPETSDHMLIVGSSVSTSDAIQLGRLGFSHLYTLPDESERLIEKVVGSYDQWKQTQQSRKPITTSESGLVGESLPVKRLKQLVDRVAPRDKLMVLIRGETGTGKGLIAKMLHDRSPRSESPFVEINCTAIPDGLIESELFGHEKGAFTDAHKSRKGIFELANGGTLFLDEIGYLKPEIQVKLLKVLEDRRFRRVGGERDIQVDCRIITGTSVDLEQKIKEDTFRKDLYYRLNVFPIHIPPLRERGEDILRLAEFFRNHFSQEHGINTKGFSSQASDYLVRCPWNGNVRELKHAIERAVILSDNTVVELSALMGEISEIDSGVSMTGEAMDLSQRVSFDAERVLVVPFGLDGKPMETIQREVIEQVLQLTEGNRSEAARLLNISRSRLLRRIASSGD